MHELIHQIEGQRRELESQIQTARKFREYGKLGRAMGRSLALGRCLLILRDQLESELLEPVDLERER